MGQSLSEWLRSDRAGTSACPAARHGSAPIGRGELPGGGGAKNKLRRDTPAPKEGRVILSSRRMLLPLPVRPTKGRARARVSISSPVPRSDLDCPLACALVEPVKTTLRFGAGPEIDRVKKKACGRVRDRLPVRGCGEEGSQHTALPPSFCSLRSSLCLCPSFSFQQPRADGYGRPHRGPALAARRACDQAETARTQAAKVSSSPCLVSLADGQTSNRVKLNKGGPLLPTRISLTCLHLSGLPHMYPTSIDMATRSI